MSSTWCGFKKKRNAKIGHLLVIGSSYGEKNEKKYKSMRVNNSSFVFFRTIGCVCTTLGLVSWECNKILTFYNKTNDLFSEFTAIVG